MGGIYLRLTDIKYEVFQPCLGLISGISNARHWCRNGISFLHWCQVANGIVVVVEGMDSGTGVMVVIISIVGRSHRDVVACCKCLGLLVCCFVCFVWGEGCGRVVLISFMLLMYLAVIFMSIARYQEQSEILATFSK